MKEKKCKQCKEKFTPARPLQFLCSIPCSLEYSKEQSRKKQEKKWKEEKKVLKEKHMTISDWKSKLQKEINTLVRILDKGHGCISCGSSSTPQAGHLHSRGANDTLRFHLHNLWVQDTGCNSHKSGNQLEYLKGIEKLYGKEYKEYLEYDLIRLYPVLKLSKEEIQEKIQIVKNIVKFLKKADLIYTNKQRLALRTKYNNTIGIYVNEEQTKF